MADAADLLTEAVQAQRQRLKGANSTIGGSNFGDGAAHRVGAE